MDSSTLFRGDICIVILLCSTGILVEANGDILKRLEILEMKINTQENHIVKLLDANVRQEQTNFLLLNANIEQEKLIKKLTDAIMRQDNGKIDDLEGDFVQMKTTINTEREDESNVFKKTRVQTNGMMKEKEIDADVLEADGKQMKRFVLNESEIRIAFFARSDQREVSHIGVNQPIVFENVLFNSGGGYHSNHGTFMAPVAGVYVFSVSILSYVNAHPEIYAEVVHNGNRLAIAYGHGDSGRHDQGSVTVIAQLNNGDEVWVRNILTADESIWGTGMDVFSGFLLWAL